MKLTTENDTILLEDVFSGVLLRQPDGNEVGICMRDDTFEINVIPKGSKTPCWYRVNMQARTIEPMLAYGTDSTKTNATADA